MTKIKANNNVKVERTKYNLLQQDIADLLEINVNTYARKEKNPLELTGKELKKLALKYNCTIEHLLENL